jgi:hypothetical protein
MPAADRAALVRALAEVLLADLDAEDRERRDEREGAPA